MEGIFVKKLYYYLQIHLIVNNDTNERENYYCINNKKRLVSISFNKSNTATYLDTHNLK